MAFGFPAYHTQTYQFQTSPDRQRSVVKQSLHALNWSITGETENQLFATISTNWLSWGEKIRIEWLDTNSIKVTSQCGLPTQCVDWGKNQTNVKTLLRQLRIGDHSASSVQKQPASCL